MSEEEESIDYQLGAADIDQTSVIEDGEFVAFEMETRAVFHRLAEDIYQSPKAGVREALTNSVTATLRAIDEHELAADDAVIEITIDDTDSRPRITIEDNGIGMTMEKIRTVVSHIGRSTVRDDYQKTGQFGMGFLALFSLAGTDGGFMMETHARGKFGEPIAGVWKNGGFTRFETAPPSTQDMRGTKLEIVVREDVSAEDLREWIEETAQWSRVPVLYEEHQEDGGVSSEEFGVAPLESLLPEDEVPYVAIETPYFKAVNAPQLEDTPTILLDVPIERSDAKIPYLPWNDVAVRLKTEHPVVIRGEYEGLMVVTDVEYEQMESERQKKYVPESHLSEDDVVTPEPTGTREALSESALFWAEVGIAIEEAYTQKINQIIKLISKNGFGAVSGSEWNLVKDVLPVEVDTYDRFCKLVAARHSSVVTDESIEQLYAGAQYVDIIPDSAETYTNSTEYVEEEVAEIERSNPDYVFMVTGHINEEKIARAFAADAIVVEVPSADWYDFYEDTVGWEPLSKATDTHAVCSRVNGEELEQYLSTTTSEMEEQPPTVTIRQSKFSRTYEIDNLTECIKPDDDSYFLDIDGVHIEELIVFEPASEFNVSEFTWLGAGQSKRAVVRADTNNEVQKLLSLPVSRTITDYIEAARQYEVVTSDGVMRFGEVQTGNAFIHILPDDTHTKLLTCEENCQKLKQLFEEKAFYGVGAGMTARDLYVPLSKSDLNSVLPLIQSAKIVSTATSDADISANTGPTIEQCKLYLKQFESRETDIIKTLDKAVFSGNEPFDVQLSFMSLLDEIDEHGIEIEEVSFDE